MNWTEQAESMMKTWTETQKKAWESWYELAQNAPASKAFPIEAMNPFAMLQKGIAAWTAESDSAAKDAAGQIFNSQRSMMRTLDLLTKSWGIVAPNLEAGKDWQPDLSKFTSQWLEQLTGAPTRMTESVSDMNELWQSFMNEWGPLLKPWMASMNQMMHGHMGEGLLGGSSGLNKLLSLEADGLSRLFDIETNRDLAFDRLAEIPSVGMSREQNAKILRMFDAFVDLRKVNLQYRTVLARAMEQAVERTMGKLAEMAKEGKQINSVRELTRLWLGVADGVFTEMYASTDYVDLQHKMSAAGMKFRIEQRQVVEMFMETLGLPTRSELDDAYRSLYEVRKEVKALKKALAVSQAPKPAARKSATPAKAPAK
jgi:class III poly(R)-hydroxyalkanoic acid synthase PhaE subunit